MKILKLGLCSVGAVAFALAGQGGGGQLASSEQSVSATICIDPSATIMWKTIPSASPTVAFDWPEGAATAVVSVDGETAATVTSPTPTATLSLTLPASAADEKIVALSVGYLDKGGATVSTSEAKLGLVQGVDDAAVPFCADASKRAWRRHKGERAVLLIPSGSTSFTLDGASPITSVASSAPCWYEWLRIAAGDHALNLVMNDETYEATIHHPGGLIFILR